MNVYEACMQRLELVFNEFDNISVSFSGGKDSGVLLNLCIQYIRQSNLKRKISVLHLDYEAQYELTSKYVTDMLASNADIFDVYRVCVPFKVTTCTSMTQSYWRPWEESKRNIWVSQMPKGAFTAADFPFYNERMWDYEFQERFSQWLHNRNKADRTAVLVGIRTQESLNRWRAIHSDRNYRNYKGIKWTREIYQDVYNAYPIFDWTTEDVWIANAKFHFPYNHLYDLFYQAGVGIHQMRVASPFLSEGQETLALYRVIEPHTWGKLVSRVNGVNFTGIYGGTTAMGWKSITLPEGHTWESYMYFLLSTLPEDTKLNYLAKLETSIKFWQEKGGVLDADTINALKQAGVSIQVGSKSNYNTSKLPVKMSYIDDIDIKDFKLIPTYKRMCICIMKNDHLCKYMGFSQTKNEIARRKNIIEKYKNLL